MIFVSYVICKFLFTCTSFIHCFKLRSKGLIIFIFRRVMFIQKSDCKFGIRTWEKAYFLSISSSKSSI